jgi:hypothetical protein
MDIRSLGLNGCNVSFLPIVSAFAKKIGLVEESSLTTLELTWLAGLSLRQYSSI